MTPIDLCSRIVSASPLTGFSKRCRMDSLQATYIEDEEEDDDGQEPPTTNHSNLAPVITTNAIELPEQAQNDTETSQNGDSTKHQDPFVSESDPTTSNDTEKPTPKVEDIEEDEDDDEDDDEDEDEDPPPKKQKQKQLSSLTQPEQQREPTAINDNGNNVSNQTKTTTTTTTTPTQTTTVKKKSKKKNNNNVWVTRSTRKGKKKTKPNPQNAPAEDTVLITPVPRFPDKSDDTPDMTICLSKVYKAEKVELSDDRLGAASTKGYRMVRATRGVCEGAWYFEIKVANLGETGHTRLGWSTEKGDLQAPVGYDGNSFGYRDIDGSKVHKALREKYGEEGYKEGDVIGFYISLPEGSLYAPNPPHLVWYKGQRYVCAPDAKEDPPKIIPGEFFMMLFLFRFCLLFGLFCYITLEHGFTFEAGV